MIGADLEPGDVHTSAAAGSETPGFFTEVPGPSPIRRPERIAVADEFTAEETALYDELAERAGEVARRILAERGLIYLDDLAPEAARDLLRIAWREAAQARFEGQDVSELHAEIDLMVDSLVMSSESGAPAPASIH